MLPKKKLYVISRLEILHDFHERNYSFTFAEEKKNYNFTFT